MHPLLTATLFVMVLTITIVWILSALGIITSVVSTIISTICSVIGSLATVVSLLELFPGADVPSPPSPVQETIKQPSPYVQTLSHTIPYHTLAAVQPPTTSKAILQRKQAVKEVYEQLMQPDTTTVVLTGIGGAGKSTLAGLVSQHAEALRQQSIGSFTAPALWLQIVPSATIEDIIGTIYEAEAKPLPDLSHLSPQDQVRHLFHMLSAINNPRLIILDQFECLLDWDTGKARADRPGMGEWIDAMNSQPLRCRFLITSRRRPSGTREYPPAYMYEYPVRRFTVVEGKELLRQLGIQATDAELQQAIEYCEGHPYALTLCASLIRLHHIKLSTLLNDPAYVRLWTGNVARNLLDSIGSQLNKLQCQLLLTCSAFREPISFDAIWAVMNPEDAETKIQIQFALETLLNQHLLQTASEKTYQLHAIVSSYAREHFAPDDDQANQQTLRKIHEQAAKYYLQQAAKRRLGKNTRRSLDDMHNWLEAIWQLCQAKLHAQAYDLVKHEDIFTALKQSASNAILLEFCQLLLSSDHWKPQPEQIAYLYNTLGDAHSAFGQNEQAQTYYQQVLALDLGPDHEIQRAHALSYSGRIWNILGNGQQAQTYLEQALALLNNTQNRSALMEVLTNLGWVYYDRGQMDQARNYFEQALHIARALADQRQEGLLQGYLGRVAADSGQKWEAQQYYKQAINFLKGVGDRNSEAIMLANLGRVTHVLGDSEQGKRSLEQALDIIKETGDRNAEATVTNDLGMLCAETGHIEQAKDYFEQSLQLRQAVGNRRGESRVLIDQGNIYMSEGMIEQAKDCFEQALQILREIGPGWREVRPLKKLGNVYKALNQNTKALTFYKEALHICRSKVNRWEESNILLKIGSLYLTQDHYDTALAFLVLAKTIANEVKSTDIDKIEKNITYIYTKIGEEQFNMLLSTVEPCAGQITEEILNN